MHLAALAHDTAGTPEQIMAVNVLGTWHVLLAAEAVGATRVICFSSAHQYQRVRDRWRAQPDAEWQPFWEYGAFVDVRDVAAAVRQALTVPLVGHHRALLCAPEIAGTAPSLELAARLAPRVPVTDPARYRADPWAALMDSSTATSTLNWHPAHHWSHPEG